MVALHNDSDSVRIVHKGNRIAQLIIQPYIHTYLEEADDLTDTARGQGGFGSTGVTKSTVEKAESYDYEQISLYDAIHN